MNTSLQFQFLNQICLLLLLLLHSNLDAQIIDIPDHGLKYKILNQNQVDTDGDNEISLSEALATTELDLGQNFYEDIEEITGLEAFVNLEILDLAGQYSFDQIDLSSFPKLRVLFLNGKPNVESLDFSNNMQLVELSVSGCRSLSSLDLQPLLNLKVLNAGYVPIEEIDLSFQDSLEVLDLNACQYLKSIDLSNLQKLEKLNVGGCGKLVSLNIQSCPELRYLNVSSVPLKILDLSHSLKLEELYVYNSFISTLNLWYLENLIRVECGNSNLSLIFFKNNSKLHTLKIRNTEVRKLTLEGLDSLRYLDVKDNKLTELNLSGAPNLYEIFCANNDLHELIVNNLASLRRIYCENNKLTKLDVSNNSSMHYLGCQDNNISELILDNNPRLSSININNNFIRNLDFESVPGLTYFRAQNNFFRQLILELPELDFLDLTGSPALELLDIYDCPKLDKLYLGNITQYVKVCIYIKTFDLIKTGSNLIELMRCSTPVEEIVDSNCNIYPNPTTDYLIIDFGESNHSYNLVELIGMNGHVNLTEEIEIQSAQVKLAVFDLPKGNYYVSIRGEKGSLIKLISIQ